MRRSAKRGECRSEMTKRDRDQGKRLEIVAWAKEHNLVINPSKGYELYIRQFFEFGRCPCDKTGKRTKCPCPESLEDVKERGWCLCRLYYRDLETFRKTLKGGQDEEIIREAGAAAN